MSALNKELKDYIDKKVLPIYDKNENGHGIDHIYYVIRRCLEFAKNFPEVNLEMLYTMASYHDIAHHIDKNNHEILSAFMFYNNLDMKRFFTEEERVIIKEAIEDHRASSKRIPRSIYGKILSSADRSTSIDDFMERMYYYMKNYFPNRSLDDIIDRSYLYMMQKYGEDGYANSYVEDIEYKKFKSDVNILLSDKKEFKKRYLKVINFNK